MVDNMRPSFILERTDSSATFLGCAAEETVGWYHNHPPAQPYDICFASDRDVQTLTDYKRYKAMLISCDGGRFVYRLKGSPEDYYFDALDYATQK